MSDLTRYQCDFCGNAYNQEPAETHEIDGEDHDVCEECEHEFQRVTNYSDKAFGNGYQYHGIYFPKSVDAEAVWRHFWWLQDNYNGLAEWVLLNKLIMAFHSDYIKQVDDQYDSDGNQDGFGEVRSEMESEVWADDDFNRVR